MSWGRAALLAALFGLAWWRWDARELYPLRILVTLLHEFGHGLAANILFGTALAAVGTGVVLMILD